VDGKDPIKTDRPVNFDFSAVARKRQRMNDGEAMDTDVNENGEVGTQTRSKSRNRSQSHIRGPTRDKSGMRPVQSDKARKMLKQGQKEMNQNARVGEGDRRFMDKKPKHLISGKRGMGKTDRR